MMNPDKRKNLIGNWPKWSQIGFGDGRRASRSGLLKRKKEAALSYREGRFSICQRISLSTLVV